MHRTRTRSFFPWSRVLLVGLLLLVCASWGYAASISTTPQTFSGTIIAGQSFGSPVFINSASGEGIYATQMDMVLPDTLTVDQVIPSALLSGEGYQLRWSILKESGQSILRTGLFSLNGMANPLSGTFGQSDTLYTISFGVPNLPGQTATLAPDYYEFATRTGSILNSGTDYTIDPSTMQIENGIVLPEQSAGSIVTVEQDAVHNADLAVAWPETAQGSSAEDLFMLRNNGDTAQEVWIDLGGFTLYNLFDFFTDGTKSRAIRANSPITVNPGASVQVYGTFTPGSAGQYPTNALLRNAAGQVLGGCWMRGSCTAQPAALLESDSKVLKFPRVANGASLAKHFGITNIGTASFSGTLSITGNNAFTIDSGAAINGLAPGETHAVAVSFTPNKGSTPYNAKLRAAAGPGSLLLKPFALTLKGKKEADGPRGAVEPRMLNLSDSDTTATFTVSNIGTEKITLAAPALTGRSSTEFSCSPSDETTLAVGGTREYTVTFAPGSTPTSAAKLTLTMTSASGYDQDFVVRLRGRSSVPQPKVLPRRGTLRFGSAFVGQYKTKSVSIENCGSANLTVTGSLTGSPFSFALVQGGTTSYITDVAAALGNGGVVAPGETRTLLIAFNPAEVASYSGSLSLQFNDPLATQKSYALTGEGNEILAPACSCNPGGVLFPDIKKDETAPDQYLMLTNSGNAPGLEVRGTLAGANANFFTLDPLLAGGDTLNVDEEKSYSVGFTGDVPGTYVASLMVQTNEPENPGFADSPTKTIEILLSATVLDLGPDETGQGGMPNTPQFGGCTISSVNPQPLTGSMLVLVQSSYGDSLQVPQGLWHVRARSGVGEEVVLTALCRNLDAATFAVGQWFKIAWDPESMTDYGTFVPLLFETTSDVLKEACLYPQPGHPGAGYAIKRSNNGVYTMELHLVEGGIYDFDKIANGKLYDPSGLGVLITPTPTPGSPNPNPGTPTSSPIAPPAPETTGTPTPAPVPAMIVDGTVEGGTLTSSESLSAHELEEALSALSALAAAEGYGSVVLIGGRLITITFDEGLTEATLAVLLRNISDEGVVAFYAWNAATDAWQKINTVEANSGASRGAGGTRDVDRHIVLKDGGWYDETTAGDGVVTFRLCGTLLSEQTEVTPVPTSVITGAPTTGPTPGADSGSSDPFGCSLGYVGGLGLLLLVPLLLLFPLSGTKQ